ARAGGGVAWRFHAEADAAGNHVAIGVHDLAVDDLADDLAVGTVDGFAAHTAEQVALGVADHLLGILAQADGCAGDGVAVQIEYFAVTNVTNLAALCVDHIVAHHGADDVAVGVAYHQHGVGQWRAV